MTDDRRVLVILALAPIPIVGNSILSYLALRILGGARKAIALIALGTAVSIGVLSSLTLVNHVLALYLILIDVIATLVSVLIAYKLSAPKTRITDYYIEVEATTISFGLSGLEPEELFDRAVKRVQGFFNQHYRSYLNKAIECKGRVKVIVSEREKELKLVKKCNEFSVLVALNKGVVSVTLTVPY